MNNEISEEAVKRIIKASAPERESEFNELWEKYKPQIEFIEDKKGFSLEAGAFGLIFFNHKSMSQIWLLGFAAQKAFYAYSPFLILSQLMKWPLETEVFLNDDSSKEVVEETQNILNKIIELKESISVDDFNWPKNIPEPSKGKPNDVDGSMVFDLLCMSGAYNFLHEIKHIIFKESEECISTIEEEMACDAYAREFLLGKINVYSEMSGYDYNLLCFICMNNVLLSLKAN